MGGGGQKKRDREIEREREANQRREEQFVQQEQRRLEEQRKALEVQRQEFLTQQEQRMKEISQQFEGQLGLATERNQQLQAQYENTLSELQKTQDAEYRRKREGKNFSILGAGLSDVQPDDTERELRTLQQQQGQQEDLFNQKLQEELKRQQEQFQQQLAQQTESLNTDFLSRFEEQQQRFEGLLGNTRTEYEDQLGQLTGILSQREGQIGDLTGQLGQSAEQISSLTNTTDELRARQEELDALIGTQNNRILQLDSAKQREDIEANREVRDQVNFLSSQFSDEEQRRQRQRGLLSQRGFSRQRGASLLR